MKALILYRRWMHTLMIGGVLLATFGITAAASANSCGSTVTVVSGDTLNGIAATCGVSLSALESANPQITNANLIYVGQVINIPSSSQVGLPNTGGQTYTVVAGDNLTSIAANFGVSLSA